MNISRKEFFMKSLLSLGETVFSVKNVLHPDSPQEMPVAEPAEHLATPCKELLAAPRNESCLVKSCGCFSCVERCEVQAIMLVPGVGISVNQSLCTGCGTCEYVCPVHPKAVHLVPRKN